MTDFWNVELRSFVEVDRHFIIRATSDPEGCYFHARSRVSRDTNPINETWKLISFVAP
jgi:hypothetical protein